MRAFKTSGVVWVALVLAACGESLTGPSLADADFTISAEIVVDPTDPNTKIYTFDDLTPHCTATDNTPPLYEDLAFQDPHPLEVCAFAGWDGEPTIGLQPIALFSASETMVELPSEATAVSIRSSLRQSGAVTPTLNAYAADGSLIASDSDGATEWTILSVDGAGAAIHSIGLYMPPLGVFLDDLTVTYASGDGGDGGDGGDPPADPASKAECAEDGWVAFGFGNQGQCVRFVETGVDSRGAATSQSPRR